MLPLRSVLGLVNLCLTVPYISREITITRSSRLSFQPRLHLASSCRKKMLSTNLCLSLFVVVIFVATAYCDWNPCQGRKDGDIVQIGCRSYTVCARGTPTVYNCTGALVYDRDLRRCVRISEKRNACGQPADCYGKPDGYYPDVLYGCSTFYGCTGQQFVGRLYCDANLVYNKEANACGYVYQVPPPCGTKI